MTTSASIWLCDSVHQQEPHCNSICWRIWNKKTSLDFIQGDLVTEDLTLLMIRLWYSSRTWLQGRGHTRYCVCVLMSFCVVFVGGTYVLRVCLQMCLYSICLWGTCEDRDAQLLTVDTHCMCWIETGASPSQPPSGTEAQRCCLPFFPHPLLRKCLRRVCLCQGQSPCRLAKAKG